MHLMIDFSIDGMTTRQDLGPIPQFMVGTPSEKRTQNRLAHWQVVENLQHVEENRDRDTVQHNRLA